MSAPQPAEIHFTASPSDEDLAALTAIIAQANTAAGWPDANYRALGLFLRDAEGKAIGGLSGYLLFEWLFVQFLAVPESLRGQGVGERLLSEAEAFARTHGGIGLWLDTFAFGPVGYYERLGFSVVGSIEDHPRGSRRLFLCKRFA